MSILQIIQNVSDLSVQSKRTDEKLHKKYGLKSGITLGDPASEDYLDEAEQTNTALVDYLNSLDVSDIKKLVTLVYAGQPLSELKRDGSIDVFHHDLKLNGVHDRSKAEYIQILRSKDKNIAQHFKSAIDQLIEMRIDVETSLERLD